MLKALQDMFGNGLDFLSARKARVNKHEKVAIGDVVLFEQAGQQKVGFIICHVSLKPSGSDKADAVTFVHVLTERSTHRGSSDFQDSGQHSAVAYLAAWPQPLSINPKAPASLLPGDGRASPHSAYSS